MFIAICKWQISNGGSRLWRRQRLDWNPVMNASPSRVLVLSAGFLAAWLAQNSRSASAAEPQSADVVVYGGTAGGVAAAVQAPGWARRRRHRAEQAPRRPHHRRSGLDRHRQQGRHRRHLARVLPACQEALRTTRRWTHEDRDKHKQYREGRGRDVGLRAAASPRRSSNRC